MLKVRRASWGIYYIVIPLGLDVNQVRREFNDGFG